MIQQQILSEARSAAAAARRRLVDVLEEKLALAPDAFADALSATLRVPVIRMDELRRAAPAFEALPFNECSQRGCALVRAESGAMLLVADDPFSSELVSWAEERLSTVPFAWRLALGVAAAAALAAMVIERPWSVRREALT